MHPISSTSPHRQTQKCFPFLAPVQALLSKIFPTKPDSVSTPPSRQTGTQADMRVATAYQHTNLPFFQQNDTGNLTQQNTPQNFANTRSQSIKIVQHKSTPKNPTEKVKDSELQEIHDRHELSVQQMFNRINSKKDVTVANETFPPVTFKRIQHSLAFSAVQLTTEVDEEHSVAHSETSEHSLVVDALFHLDLE